MELKVPYSTTYQTLTLPIGSQVEVLESAIHGSGPGQGEDQLVLAAMEHPAGPRLEELTRGKRSAVIICSDHTRPVPSRKIMPHMLSALRRGSPGIDVTLLVATGCHRPPTGEELLHKFGEKILEEERIVLHDCTDESSLVDIGLLPSGARLVLNKLAVETDLLLAEGFIEPHFFAGFSGGRKSVLPGIAGRATVLGNHCAAFIDSPHARTGILEGNPIHRDMVEAAKMAGLRYIVNVVIDGEKRVAAAFAGEPEAAHRAGCSYLRERCFVTCQAPGDIVITSNGGAPLDQNIYQAVKGMTAGEAAAAPDGVIILCAACEDGTGGDDFYRALKDCASPSDLLEQIRQVPMDQTEPDQWQTQILARILAKHRVILVTRPELAETVREMKMEYASSLGKAYTMAREAKGPKARLVIIPDGVSVVVGRKN